MKKIILMPTYNERDNVQWIIPRIFSLCPDVKIIVVDDNSPDGTAEEIKKLSKNFSGLALLQRSKKEGLGEAYKYALSHCLKNEDFDAILTMDADGSHDPIYLENMFKLLDDFDVVVGSRYVKGGGVENWSLGRRLLSRFGNIYARMITGLKVYDQTAGFVAVKRNILEKVDMSKMKSNGYSYQIEFKFHCIALSGAKYVELPIVFRERKIGSSKMSGAIFFEALATPWRLKRLK